MAIKILYRLFPKLIFLYRKYTNVNKEIEMQLLSILCHPNMTSLDVGAKFGMYTYRLKLHSKKVMAFEPIKDLNVALSKIFHKHSIDVIAMALSNRSGTILMRTPLYKSGNPCYGRSSIESENHLQFIKIEGWDEFLVDMVCLDNLKIENVGFIKIDVEGHEQAVLEGGQNTIQRCKPAMLIEANNNHLPKAIEKLIAWAECNNYLIFFMDGRKIFPVLKFDIEYHHIQKGLQNFILIHSGDVDRLQKITYYLHPNTVK